MEDLAADSAARGAAMVAEASAALAAGGLVEHAADSAVEEASTVEVEADFTAAAAVADANRLPNN